VNFCTDFIVWSVSIETNWNMIYSGQYRLTTAVTEIQDTSAGVIIPTLKKKPLNSLSRVVTVPSCLFNGPFLTGRVRCYKRAVCVFIGTIKNEFNQTAINIT